MIILDLRKPITPNLRMLNSKTSLSVGGGSQDIQLKTSLGLLIHLLAFYVEKYRLINAPFGELFSYVSVLLVK